MSQKIVYIVVIPTLYGLPHLLGAISPSKVKNSDDLLKQIKGINMQKKPVNNSTSTQNM